MSISLNGQLSIDITVDGEDLTSTSEVSSVVINESVALCVPSIDIDFINSGNLVDTKILYDGAPMTIRITTPDREDQPKYIGDEGEIRFRVLNFKTKDTNRGYSYSVSGVMDIDGLFDSQSESFTGTSSELLTSIANRVGLDADVDNTLDSQTWVRGGVKLISWIKNVVNHSWRSNSSCMVWCVGRDGTLRFKDLEKIEAAKEDWIFGQFSEDGDATYMSYDDSQAESSSGILNRIYGYGRSYFEYDISQSVREKLDVTQVAKTSKYLAMNPDLKKPQQSRSFIRVGNNTHENYHLAYVQNMRIRSLYSIMQKIISVEPKNINLLDKVLLEKLSPTTKGDPQVSYSGTYIISNIVTTITPLSITRSGMLMRNGVSPEGEVNQLGGN